MQGGESESDYKDVVDTLLCMFGKVMTREAISTIVESCDGELNLSADALMNIMSDTEKGNSIKIEPSDGSNLNKADNMETPNNHQPSRSDEQPSQTIMSYAGASRKTGAIPKISANMSKPSELVKKDTRHPNSQFQNILNRHEEGSRILIVLRGVPGSGKTYLAKQIVEQTVGSSPSDFKNHIYTTDDFFIQNGQYRYNKNLLGEAHEWNKYRVRNATENGISPVIVDNTNVAIWEMQPYIVDGVNNGYYIEIMVPNTLWAKKEHVLARKNTHGVPVDKIRRMLDNFQTGVNSDNVMKIFGLWYPDGKVPPVLREFPKPTIENIDSSDKIFIKNSEVETSENAQPTTSNFSDCDENTSNTTHSDKEPKQFITVQEVEKQLRELQRVEQEWENGESWDELSANKAPVTRTEDNGPKPPRNITNNQESVSNPSEKSLQNIGKYQEWSQIPEIVQSWTEINELFIPKNPKDPVETNTIGTSMELGDTSAVTGQAFRVLTAKPRDINLLYKAESKEKIPDVRMLDKGNMTHETLMTEVPNRRCQNEEKHFDAFRKYFKNISQLVLRDIFDNCRGDVNWAFTIVLDGMANNQLILIDSDDNEDDKKEDEIHGLCDCLAMYNVIPDISAPSSSNAVSELKGSNTSETKPFEITPVKKSKKKGTLSESSQQLKKQIEGNFVIPDSYYSEHCLKIRKLRRGEFDDRGDISGPLDPPEIVQLPPQADSPILSISYVPDRLSDNIDKGNYDDMGSQFISDKKDKVVTVSLGTELVSQLDILFGRKEITYPPEVKTKVNIPMYILNELNVLWMESLMNQIEEQDIQTAIMIKQDEEFARQLGLKEAELEKAGIEPDVPDFKEIMDMEYALSLYQKDIADWRNKVPNDLAAKLSRDKLYNLFPDIAKDTLAELLMAYENNFQATVEALLMSTGKADILQRKNGINKFIMESELATSHEKLQEEKKKLSDEEWPLLPQETEISMETVDSFRKEASDHLLQRNLNHQKAEECIRRGMTTAAGFYSEMAMVCKLKFEQANSKAANALIHYHANNAENVTTLDLHYLHVKEAKEALDIFIDRHIQILREKRTSQRFQILYIITGRGIHSNGVPRVKPAVLRRLEERRIVFCESNPGLLSARVHADNFMSHQLNR